MTDLAQLIPPTCKEPLSQTFSTNINLLQLLLASYSELSGICNAALFTYY